MGFFCVFFEVRYKIFVEISRPFPFFPKIIYPISYCKEHLFFSILQIYWSFCSLFLWISLDYSHIYFSFHMNYLMFLLCISQANRLFSFNLYFLHHSWTNCPIAFFKYLYIFVSYKLYIVYCHTLYVFHPNLPLLTHVSYPHSFIYLSELRLD